MTFHIRFTCFVAWLVAVATTFAPIAESVAATRRKPVAKAPAKARAQAKAKVSSAKVSSAKVSSVKGKGARGKSGAKAAPKGKTAARPSAKDDAARRRCAARKHKNSKECKALAARSGSGGKSAKTDGMARKCAQKAHRSSKACRKYVAEKKKRAVRHSICGRRYGRAKKNETVARFARRHRVAEGTVRALNGLGGARRLKGGKRYLVYKSPHDGVTLHNGVLLEGDGERMDLQRPHRGWGKPLLVEAIRAAAQQVHASAPVATRLVVGDLSKEGGGCLPPHRSHRGGLDADIGFYMRGGHQRGWLGLATPETLDADRTWLLLKAFLSTGRLQYAFIDYGLQKPLYEAALRAGEAPERLAGVFQYPREVERTREAIVRHLKGHADHMHVRFTCDDPETCGLADENRERIAGLRIEQRGGSKHAPGHRAGRALAYRSRAAGVAVPVALP